MPDMNLGDMLGYKLASFNRQGCDRNVLVGAILTIACHFRNLLDDVLSFHYFAEDGVLAGEPVSVRDGDKEL